MEANIGETIKHSAFTGLPFTMGNRKNKKKSDTCGMSLLQHSRDLYIHLSVLKIKKDKSLNLMTFRMLFDRIQNYKTVAYEDLVW